MLSLHYTKAIRAHRVKALLSSYKNQKVPRNKLETKGGHIKLMSSELFS